MSEKYIFNGKVYRSVSEMPSDVRQLYDRLETLLQDQDRDGVPNVFQQGGFKGIKDAFGLIKDVSKMSQSGEKWSSQQMVLIKETDTSISVNGKTFRSVNEMPSEIRRVYQKAVREAEIAETSAPTSSQIYDEPWRERKRDSYFQPHDDENFKPKVRTPLNSSVIQPVNSNIGLVLAVVLGILFCAGAGVFYLLANGNLF